MNLVKKRPMRVLVVVLSFSLFGCKAQLPDSPEEAYLSFSAARQAGNHKLAWSFLSQRTQATVRARAEAIAAASHGTVVNEPEAMIFQGTTAPVFVKDLTRRIAEPEKVILQVERGGLKTEVTLVKESSRWLIDLSDTLQGPPRE
jgi:hypothetical protein